jgi:thiopeptide-type bacteriocin biosynthesis protein
MTRAGRKTTKPETRRQPLYEALDWTVVRAPLLPVEAYLALGRSTPHGSARECRGTVTLESPPEARLPANPAVRAALAVGGGKLYDALVRGGASGKDDPESAGKLLRYLIRMSTRPTPYGLFAGVALARWGPETDLALASGAPRTRTRPDMAWLVRLVMEAEKRPEVRRQLHYTANHRAFLHAGRVFLPEPAPAGDSSVQVQAVSGRASAPVRRALGMARSRVSHGRLAAELASFPGATLEKAEKLIDDLWRQTFLLTDLRPPLTEPNPAAYVARHLQDIPAAADLLDRLQTALSGAAEWDALPIEKAAGAFRTLAAQHARWNGAGPEPCPQVDMALQLAGSRVSHAVATEAARAADLLVRLTPLPAGVPYLDSYRRQFESRYGTDREVALLELLDPNAGLGLPSPFQASAPGGDPRKMASRQQTLYDLAVTALRDRQLVVELDEKKLRRLETWTPAPAAAPLSMDLSVFVVAASAADVDGGNFQVVVGPNLGATAAGRNLGRFADLLGAEAEAALEAVGEAESARQGGGLWAELVYLPRQFRHANVAVRPHPRPYEIPIGTTPGLPPEQVIPVGELVVGVRNNRLYVRWPAKDADVLACSGHMLSNMHAPDVCRFLDDVRRDGEAQFSSFDWGQASGLPVLPRVQAGRAVLCPAQWRIDGSVRSELAPESRGAFEVGLRTWRARWQVPRHVYLSYGDNRLLLDLESEQQIEQLRAEVRKLPEGAHLRLQEPLPAPEHAWVSGPGGHFIAELMVPLVLRTGRTSSNAAAPRRKVVAYAAADRRRLPGSEWLFAKLYCPRVFEDELLTGPVAEFCEEALATGAADDWFFIRYADPDPHLRLRFRGVPERLTGELAPRVCAWAEMLIGSGLGTRLCFDTYERELERFGGPAGTEAAEAIFGADSSAVLEILRLSRDGVFGMDLTALAALSIDDLLAGLGAGEAERTEWCRKRAGPHSVAGDEYRRRKDFLRSLLGDAEWIRSQPGGDAVARALASRRREVEVAGRRLEALEAAGLLSQPRTQLFGSYVHLHCNRLLGVDRQAEEQALGLLARTRYGLSQAPLSLPAGTG